MTQDLPLSVIVAAYNSPPGFLDLVKSLDRQTLPKNKFEVIIVDDGSTDDTLATLKNIAKVRSNYSILSIPNSGWPSKPRNTALSVARGKFVFFCDHDDYVFPEALERMIELADETGCDVLHPKEVVAGWSSPGWNGWQSGNSLVKKLTDNDVQCITPHKLYRTHFLRKNDIIFPENMSRLEDFSFNAQVWSKTKAVATLSDYPCYKWIIYENNSHKAGYDFDQYWDSFRNSVQPILTMDDGDSRKLVLLRRWYRSRLLERLGPIYATYSKEYREKINSKFIELLHLFPAVLDSGLNYADSLRSALLRKNEFGALLKMAEFDTGIRMRTQTDKIQWINGALFQQVSVRLLGADNMECEFSNNSGRINRVLPSEVVACFTDVELGKLSIRVDELDLEFAIRSRATSVDWVLPSISVNIVLPEIGSTAPIEFVATCLIDPKTAAFGNSLETGISDCFVRILGLGLSNTQRVAVSQKQVRPALLSGIPVIPYSTQDGFLALDIGATYRTLVGSAQPSLEHSVRTPERLTIFLNSVHTVGESAGEASLELITGALQNASLESRHARAYLIVDCDLSSNLVSSRAVIGGRRSAPLFK